jgi:hypothetical protein
MFIESPKIILRSAARGDFPISTETSVLSDKTGNLLPVEIGKQGISRSVRKLLVYLIGRPTNV